MGTAFSARDVMAIAEAVGEDNLLRYWGKYSARITITSIKHARLLVWHDTRRDARRHVPGQGRQSHPRRGAEPARILPRARVRVFRYSPPLTSSDYEEWSRSDEVYSLFFDECVRANCILTHYASSGRELQRLVDDKLNALKTQPVPIGQVIYDYTFFLGIINDGLYTTTAWPNLASVIDMMLSDDMDNAHMHKEADANVAHSKEELNGLVAFVYYLMGIHCSDRFPRVSTLEEFKAAFDKMFNVSRTIAASSLNMLMTCAQWKMDAKERYAGDFNVEPKNPVLLIGNTYDAYTPLRSAKNVSAGFKGSEVLEVNGYGVRITKGIQESH